MVKVFIMSTEIRGENTTQSMSIINRVLLDCVDATEKAYKFETDTHKTIWIPKSQLNLVSFYNTDDLETRRTIFQVAQGLNCEANTVLLGSVTNWFFKKNLLKLSTMQERSGKFNKMGMTIRDSERLTKEYITKLKL